MSDSADSVVQHVRTRFGRRFAEWQTGEAVLTESARYQDRASNARFTSSADHVTALEAALVARESGDFSAATNGLRTLLLHTALSDRVRSEAHCSLGDLLQLAGESADTWLPHIVACLTFQENHELALSAVHRARMGSLTPDANSERETPGPRIVLVLGSNFATIAFANEFLRQHRVVGIIQQYAEFPAVEPRYRPDAEALPLGLSEPEMRSFDDETVLGNSWNALFVDPSVPIRYISRGEAHSPAVMSWMSQLRPDVIVSHGPERLSGEFIALAPLGGLNVHWGLSPTYRGMHTCRWALVHGLPEWVGVTVHKLDPGLDSGPILYQARPQFEEGDTIRRLEYRLTMLAVSIVPHAVEEVVAGTVRASDQDLTAGKEYRLCEWAKEYDARLTPQYIGELAGAYIENQDERNRRAPLINPWPADR